MLSSEKNTWIAPLFIGTLLVILLCVLYVSTDFINQDTSRVRKEFDYAGRAVQPIVNKDQVILKKNERIDVGRYGLVFKGVNKKTILINLYLLDMDPEQPYEKRFLKKDAKKEMKFGQDKYRLLSVNSNHLILKTF